MNLLFYWKSLLLFTQILHIMFADHMPFKPPALDALMYLSESDMQYQRNKGIKKK